jgi:hypothetical protein
MKKLYRGPYIDAFCQVWFDLVQLFQRSRLKYEKLTDRRQVMAIPHMTLWVRWAKKRGISLIRGKLSFLLKEMILFFRNKNCSWMPCFLQDQIKPRKITVEKLTIHHLYTNYNSFVLLDSGKMICQVSANEKNSNWATSFRRDNQLCELLMMTKERLTMDTKWWQELTWSLASWARFDGRCLK